MAQWLNAMFEHIDINSLLSGAFGVLSAFATIKARLTLIEYKHSELRKRFDAHEKKAAH